MEDIQTLRPLSEAFVHWQKHHVDLTIKDKLRSSLPSPQDIYYALPFTQPCVFMLLEVNLYIILSFVMHHKHAMEYL